MALHNIRTIFLVVCAAGLTIIGCASTAPPRIEAPSGAIQEPSKHFWWYARFRMDWPAGHSPEWATDLLLADGVVEPVLASHRSDIPLWRFHRCALRDNSGHQFSFIFFTNRKTAGQVFEQLRASRVLHELQKNGMVRKFLVDNVNGARPTAISATSDKNWSKPLQQAWPHYIMGVSAMWLSLINQVAAKSAFTGDGGTDLIAEYRKINEKITLIWRNEAEHALFHHLNALFGYEPLNLQMKVRF